MTRHGENAIGLGLLACALAFNAIFLAPELRIGRLPVNDATFHLAAAERLGQSLANGEPFLDPWVSEWALGYPVWRSYQPVPHVLAAGFLALSPDQKAHAAWFAALQLLLLCLLPASVYVGARLLGLGPLAGGLAACLALAPNGFGEFGRYGLGYGATTWRGSGLFTQLVALHLLLPCLGLLAHGLDAGKRRPLAALLLAMTSLSHIIFGYVAFASAGLLAVVGPRGERSRRVVRLATVVLPSLVLLAWFVIPLLLADGTINHSRWEEPTKWDSFGAPTILRELASGRLLDAGRAPILTLLVAVGAVGAALAWREVIARRLLALAGLWLALFFGRATWGYLLVVFGIPHDFHLHRLQAAFEIFAVLLAAWGAGRLVSLSWRADRRVGAVVAAGIAFALVVVGMDRARYLRENAAWGEANLEAFQRERSDIEATLRDVRAVLAERPGRVSAGLAATEGKDFKVGAVPFYALLTREHLDQASFLYHSMSLTSDVMPIRDETSLVHDTVFGIRVVVAPATRPVPPFLRKRGQHGRFAVYEASPEGYFGLVDVGARYTGSPDTTYEPSAAWLQSPLAAAGIVVALGEGDPNLPEVARWQPFPAPPQRLLTPRGGILAEDKRGEVYSARVVLLRSCHVFVKITWDPGLKATVDGREVPLLRVTPGFSAVAAPAGSHEVVVRYRPGPLRPILFVLGLGLFVGCTWVLARPRTPATEASAVAWLAGRTGKLATPRVQAAVALALLALVALRPLLRGHLIDGHDATEYPPRLVEIARAVAGGQLPPLWAPDLGNGYGQPLFEFAPPLVYAAALPWYALGAKLADAIQFGLLLLCGAGAVAVYRLARRWGASRAPSLAGAAMWLFTPYLSLDLFVRAAFAEAAALAVAPIGLLGLLRAMDRPSPARVMLGGGGVALIILAHNGVALLLLPLLGLFVIASGVGTGGHLRRALVGLATLATGLGLAAFFWLPAFAERGFVKVNLLREGFLAWSQHAVYPIQLLWSHWGYGLSVPGPGDTMSFAIGVPHLLLGVAGTILLLRVRAPRRLSEGLACAAAAAAGAWLATTWAAPVWSRAEMLQYLAYPWRCLFLPALFLPLLAVPAFARLPRRAMVAAVALLVLLNIAHTEPKGYLTFDDEYYAPSSIAARGINTSTREEYEPRWVVVRPPPTVRKLTGVRAPVDILASRLSSSKQEYTVRVPRPTDVEVATFYYPGWNVTVDGKAAPLSVEPVRGTMVFPITPGEHHVRVSLATTKIRRAGGWLSAATLGIVALAGLAGRLRRPKERELPVGEDDPPRI